MKNNKGHIIIALILISFFQIFFFIKKSEINNNNNKVTKFESNNEVVTFKEINDDLSAINKLEVLEIENKDEVWTAKVTLTGNENNIKESLQLLKNFKIISYNIDGSNGDFNVNLDIIRKFN